MARARPATARVIVWVPFLIPSGLPAEVRMVKPPTRIMTNEMRPMRGIAASRMLPT